MNELAIYQQGAKHHAHAVHYSRYYTLDQLRHFYSTASIGFICASVGSWALMSFFVGQFFAGAEFEYMDDWRFIQYVYAGMGIAIATAIIIAEAVLFNSGRAREYWFVVGFAVSFSIFAESAATMQREQSTVAFRSTQSEVYKATIRAVDVLATTSTLTPSQVQLSRLQASYDEAKRLGKRSAMDAIQKRMVQAEHSAELEQGNRTNALLSTITQAKALEYDETKHQAMIRFLAEAFGMSHVFSSALLAFFLILTFKICFHYLGTMRQLNARAISINTGHLSASIESFRVNPSGFPDHKTGATLPRSALKKREPIPGEEEHRQELHEHVIHVHVENESSEKSSVYDRAEGAKVGAVVECPQCGKSFQKANKWHTFCKSPCRDTWHNERDPSRLKAKKGRAGTE